MKIPVKVNKIVKAGPKKQRKFKGLKIVPIDRGRVNDVFIGLRNHMAHGNVRNLTVIFETKDNTAYVRSTMTESDLLWYLKRHEDLIMTRARVNN